MSTHTTTSADGGLSSIVCALNYLNLKFWWMFLRNLDRSHPSLLHLGSVNPGPRLAVQPHRLCTTVLVLYLRSRLAYRNELSQLTEDALQETTTI